MATVLEPNPLMKDLKVKIQESILVSPPQQTEKRSIFLSNIDQILNYNVPTAHFFKANPDFPPEIVAKRLKMAIEKILVTYDFMAGRFKLNGETGRLEIECNGAGAGFVVASAEYRLEDLGGDFVSPSLGFRQLAAQGLDNLGPGSDQPLCVLQVTSFKCGGFALGLSTNHVLLDGIGAKIFIDNLATQAFDDERPLAVVPCLDRHLLAARSPPQVSFSHPEFFKPDLQPAVGPPVFDCAKEELDYKVFKLSPTAINYLKDKAIRSSSTTDQDNKPRKISGLTVAAALLWRCKALSSSDPIKKDRVSTLLNVIDIRSRLSPPLPASYSGNAVLVAYSSAKCEEIEEESYFSKLVEKIAEGPGRVNDEYARSVIDWLEVNKGLPCGEYMVSSWLRLGLDDVDYPWGKPIHSGPVVSHRKDICWIFPDPHYYTEKSINALVSLPAPEMARFESYFRSFFESP